MNNHRQALRRTVLVTNELGLHAKPAARIAQMAKKAGSAVFICAGETRVDAKDIVDTLTLAAAKGTVLTVCISDASDIHVLDAISAYFEHGFTE